MKFKLQLLSLLIAATLSFTGNPPAEATLTIDNKDALEAVQTTRSLFDINTGSAKKLNLYLQVIDQTLDTLSKEKKSSEFVVAFRGPSVKLLTIDQSSFKDTDQSVLNQAIGHIKTLKKKGVRFEACAIATEVFSISNEDIIPEVKVVGNTFVSLIGYQTKGYALIPIQ